ncbi:ATP-binding protein [Bradyrhizobium sp. BR 10261]|nr:ATP-binding protein [Bradyrhizobium sp. BR 10261]
MSAALQELDIQILFLTEDRQLRSSLSILKPTNDRLLRRRSEIETDSPSTDVARFSDRQRNWLDVSLIASRVQDDFRRQLIERGNFGQMNANGIYLDLAKRLASDWSTNEKSPEKSYDRFLVELDQAELRAKSLYSLRAVSEIPFQDFKQVLVGARSERRNDILRILQPFLDSTRARIDALAPLTHLLSILVKELNDFFSRKVVSFDTIDGFKVVGPTGATLPLSALSSGEKHLFLLLCSAYLSRQSKCIFLIDEPELSLNVYWQRNLPRTLQRLAEDASVQYVMATHSLEILTEFNHRISQLQS